MTEEIVKAAVAGYSLRLYGVHGLLHWGRVLENGRKLAATTGADLEVVELFAILHDCRRETDGTDPDHGRRGGEVAGHLYRKGLVRLSPERLEQLRFACDLHTAGRTVADVTIQTCWDADRLDLGRVGTRPNPRYLCTAAAKDRATIAWAEGRSRRNHRAEVVDLWLSWIA